jgi:hypothetical protein
MTTEQIFFTGAGITVTRTRVVVGSKTFALANVTSVSRGKSETNRTVGILPGALLLLGGLGGLLSGDVLWGLLAVVLGIAWGIVVFFLIPIQHLVRLRSSGGEFSVCHSPNRELVERIIGAINQAIVARG